MPGHPTYRDIETRGRFRDVPSNLRVELIVTPEGDHFRRVADEDATDPSTAAILDALPGPDLPAIDVKTLALHVGLSEATCLRALDPLINAGVVRVIGLGRKGNPKRYYRFFSSSDTGVCE